MSARKLATLAELEYRRFAHLTCNVEPACSYVGEYWAATGRSWNGKTRLVANRGLHFFPKWSAAFISYLVVNSGVVSGFTPTIAHCNYVMEATLPSTAFKVLPAYEPLMPGDILHYGREYAKFFDWPTAVAAYQSDGFYPSYGEIIVRVSDKIITTISPRYNKTVTRRARGLTQSKGTYPTMRQPPIAVLRFRR